MIEELEFHIPRLFRNKTIFRAFWATLKLGTIGRELKVGGEGF